MSFLVRNRIAILVAVAAIIISLFAPNAYYLRIMFMIGIYFLCAAGMNVLVGYAGQKSLGQAGLFAAGAYTVALLTTSGGWNPWLALIAAGFVSAAFGVLIAIPSLRVRGPYLAMVTLAFGIVVERIATEQVGIFGGPQGIFGIKPLSFFGRPLTRIELVWLVIALCLITHVLLKNLMNGRFGRALFSLQVDEIAAASAGVKVYRYKVLAFVVAAVTCGIAGGLVAHETQYINSEYFSFKLSIFILLLVLFGGPGLTYGPFLGAVILVIVDSSLARWPSVQHFVYGALLLFSLYILPRGVGGLIDDLLKRRTRKEEHAQKRGDEFTLDVPGRGDPAGSVLLEVDGLSKSYGGVKPAQNVSLQINPGKIHALIGPNGAGKSTMINMITGIVQPDSGAIKFRSQIINNRSSAQICELGIARTFQNLRLFGNLTVLENVMVGYHSRMRNGFWSSLFGTPAAFREERRAAEASETIIAALGLKGLEFASPASLPYGLQRRVELARSLAAGPELILLDEPAAGLNPVETRALGDLLQRISQAGITILMVEHHMDLVMKVSNHVIVLDYGIKIAEGTPSAVQQNPAVIAAYLGIEDEDDVHEEAK